LLDAPLIWLGIKQTSTPVHPFKHNERYCRMTQSDSILEDNTLVELALEGQAECFSVLMNRHAADRRQLNFPAVLPKGVHRREGMFDSLRQPE
jgi:hypothetical protein